MNILDKDKLILEELKSQNIEGLTDRGKLAVRELGKLNEGAVIFLILSLNSRIRDLERIIVSHKQKIIIH